MRPPAIIACLMLTVAMAISCRAAEKAPAPATVPASVQNATETDKRMPANNAKGWNFTEADPLDPALPRVLLIGDSILAGYRGGVIKALKGKANVDVWITPICQSEKTAATFKEVLSKAPYAVVHFNLGLHGVQPGRIPDDKYIPLTELLVTSMREAAPTATFIWASTTPWMSDDKNDATGFNTEMNPTVIKHNGWAAEVMAKHHIAINDLYTLMVPNMKLKANGLHWSAAGSGMQGKAVTACIEAALKSPSSPQAK